MREHASIELRRVYQACRASVARSFIPHVPFYLCTLSFGVVTAALVAMYRLPFPLASAVFFLGLVVKLGLLMTTVAALKHLWQLYAVGQTGNPLTAM